MHHPRRIGLALEVHALYKQHAEVFAGIQRYADERGWETVIDDWSEVTLASSGATRPPYDGVIARVNDRSHDLLVQTDRWGVPLVNVQRTSLVYDRLPGVFPDFKEMGRLRAEHLLSRGLRHFAHLTVSGRPVDQLMDEGFSEAIREAGYSVERCELSPTWGNELSDYQQSLETIRRWMDTWRLPIGVAVVTDMFARQLVTLCHERHWRVPGDVAIVGGNNEEKLCEMPRPSLTSIEIGYERVGYEAARLLERLMDEADARRSAGQKAVTHDPQRAPNHISLKPVGIVVRESTDFYAAEDELVTRALAYIARQSHTSLSVGDVADSLGVSSKTLQNRFREALNRSVAREIRRVRIEKAKRELADSNHSIEEIARRSGFASRTRLYEVFRRELDVTPSAYRKQRKLAGKAGRHAKAPV